VTGDIMGVPDRPGSYLHLHAGDRADATDSGGNERGGLEKKPSGRRCDDRVTALRRLADAAGPGYGGGHPAAVRPQIIDAGPR
jgi:hypothetical protein